jgi:hypothetical protein
MARDHKSHADATWLAQRGLDRARFAVIEILEGASCSGLTGEIQTRRFVIASVYAVSFYCRHHVAKVPRRHPDLRCLCFVVQGLQRRCARQLSARFDPGLYSHDRDLIIVAPLVQRHAGRRDGQAVTIVSPSSETDALTGGTRQKCLGPGHVGGGRCLMCYPARNPGSFSWTLAKSRPKAGRGGTSAGGAENFFRTTREDRRATQFERFSKLSKLSLPKDGTLPA